MSRNEDFLKTAESLKPVLLKEEAVPAGFAPRVLGENESCLLNYGNHFTGRLKLRIGYQGNHPDAPLWLRIQFAERESELEEDIDSYQGWISKSWIQREDIHLDVLPSEILLPRRYAFRYVKITVLAASSKYRMVLEEAVCIAESSADDSTLLPAHWDDDLPAEIDRTAVRTLHECMQYVFEDGPKRDRRLWLGDLRIQAKANEMTYRNYDLVKRCLYLFAGCTDEEGRIPAAVFLEPEPQRDDVMMFDYSLLFIQTLLEYYLSAGDLETLRELWPCAKRQMELAEAQFENDVVRDSDVLGWCFVDWDLNLNKQASAQGIYLYALKAAIRIAGILKEETDESLLEELFERRRAAALKYFYDPASGLFESGAKRQRSAASQIWMVLGGVKEGKEAAELLSLIEQDNVVQPVTPYLMHYRIEALTSCGEYEQALSLIKEYWGGMVKEGADTFWELYDPASPSVSPYGGTIVNSYCHAWSCAPAYFLRKYFMHDSAGDE